MSVADRRRPKPPRASWQRTQPRTWRLDSRPPRSTFREHALAGGHNLERPLRISLRYSPSPSSSIVPHSASHTQLGVIVSSVPDFRGEASFLPSRLLITRIGRDYYSPLAWLSPGLSGASLYVLSDRFRFGRQRSSCFLPLFLPELSDELVGRRRYATNGCLVVAAASPLGPRTSSTANTPTREEQQPAAARMTVMSQNALTKSNFDEGKTLELPTRQRAGSHARSVSLFPDQFRKSNTR